MNLTSYRKKRNFRKTPEPKTGRGVAPKGRLLYVIQKHAASHLHYDFRLELGGTLKSWAVPKGPSLDPEHKQLAVHVEDHPVSYGDFEGTIPQGEYGGGTVMVWDQGAWEPHGDPEEGYRKGHLSFTLRGTKLTGDWSLVAMHGKAGENRKNWLLIKKKDDSARPKKEYNILEAEPDSVLTHRGLEEISQDSGRVWKSSRVRAKTGDTPPRPAPVKTKGTRNKGAVPFPGELKESVKRKQPQALRPQLATLVSSAPSGDDWLHEMKFDGYRLLAFLSGNKVQLITRNGNDWTNQFPSVREALRQLDLKEGILDGEVVLLRENGVPDFQRLQNAIKSGRAEDFHYYVFDLPYCEGYDLRKVPLVERKRLLEQIITRQFPDNDGAIRYSEHLLGQGAEFATQSCLHDLEGIVSKRVDSPYESGRTRTWVKTKCHRRQEFVIGGFTRPQGSRSGFGALLLGYFENGKLRYCGRVGTGFTQQSLKDLEKRLSAHRTRQCPFTTRPPASRDVESWVEPVLVAEVEFSEWTDEQQLRHPSFKGLRQDKPATAITKEEPQSIGTQRERPRARTEPGKRTGDSRMSSNTASRAPVQVEGVTITHPERIVYPSTEITKQDLAEFYSDISEWILPHVVGRPLSLVRCPGGQAEQCFYQKHFDGELPAGLRSIAIKEKSKTEPYVMITKSKGLIALIQQGVLEFHPWGARGDQIERPDRIVFDLDPGEGTEWKQIVEGVKEVRSRLESLKLTSFLRTSGGKGLHVVVPLVRRSSWEDAKEFARLLASSMAQDSPRLYTAEMSKARRKGRIFVDYLRNGRGATAIASYSTRARPGAPVATPLRWDELVESLRPDAYTVLNLRQRLASLKSDPWEGFFELRQSLTRQMLEGHKPS
ncbi:DNA ligase D [Planctomicrobium sp. SH664]|uniref:DNA ligase D n=1 Tax=Planctomicrobium sp. SH664 TaxID=3448125 RepID=UPI003F5BF738